MTAPEPRPTSNLPQLRIWHRFFNNMDAEAFENPLIRLRLSTTEAPAPSKTSGSLFFQQKMCTQSLKAPATNRGCEDYPAALGKTAIARKRWGKRSPASQPRARRARASFRTRWQARDRTAPSTCCSAGWIPCSNRSRSGTKAPGSSRCQGHAASSSAGRHTYTCKWDTW